MFPNQTESPFTKRAARKGLALAVDDDPCFLQSVRMMLRVGGFAQTAGAGDVEEALTILEHHTVDLIVCDWNMSPIDGLDLLRIVRAKPALKDTPFILATASLSEEAWRGAIELGATDFLQKPFSIDHLNQSADLCLALNDARLAAAKVVSFPSRGRRGLRR